MATDLTQDCALFQGAKLRARHELGVDRIEPVDPNFADAGQLQPTRFPNIDKSHEKVEHQD